MICVRRMSGGCLVPYAELSQVLLNHLHTTDPGGEVVVRVFVAVATAVGALVAAGSRCSGAVEEITVNHHHPGCELSVVPESLVNKHTEAASQG